MDVRFQKGIEEFNSQDYFEAHDVWEDLWHEYREDDRTFLQALIQVAAGLYHLDCGNFRGARSQLSKGMEKLEPYQPSHWGVNVQALTSEVLTCMSHMTDVEQGRRPQVDLALLPFILKSEPER